MVAIPFVSKRFAMKRFLGMTAEEVAENETMWREENVDEGAELPATAELRSVGVTSAGIGSDLSAIGSATTPPPTDPGEEAALAGGAAPAESTPPA